jgi:hypothetical protein
VILLATETIGVRLERCQEKNANMLKKPDFFIIPNRAGGITHESPANKTAPIPALSFVFPLHRTDESFDMFKGSERLSYKFFQLSNVSSVIFRNLFHSEDHVI